MTEILTIVAVIAILIFFNALYVAAEFATVASRRTRVSQLAATGNRRAGALLAILEDHTKLDNYVAACQVGITISSLVVAAYGQNQIAGRLVVPLQTALGESVGSATAESIAAIGVLAFLTVVQVIIGELVPKSIAVQYPEKVALVVVDAVVWTRRILRPVIWLFNGSGRVILRLLGQENNDEHHHVYSPEEIEILVSGSHEGGLLDEDERQMLRNTFRMRDLTARQVMVHRTRIVSAPIESSVRALIDLSLEAGLTRILLYGETIDDVRGFVHIKDLFRLEVNGKEALDSIVRKLVKVPESMPVIDVWNRLRNLREYMAVVFDEYGGTAGIITIEDLVEEIFGELQDEFDDESDLIALDKDGRIYLRGDLLVADVNEYLNLHLPVETADTLGGLIISELGRAPVEGDKIELLNTTLRVETVEDLGVTEVSLMLAGANLLKFTEWELSQRD